MCIDNTKPILDLLFQTFYFLLCFLEICLGRYGTCVASAILLECLLTQISMVCKSQFYSEIKRQSETGLYKLLTLVFLPEKILSNLLEKTVKLMEPLVHLLGPTAPKILRKIGDVVKHLEQCIGKCINFLGKTTIKGGLLMANELKKTADAVVKATVAGVTVITKGLNKLTKDIAEDVGNALQTITGVVDELVPHGTKFIQSLADTTANIITGGANIIGDVANHVTNTLGNFLNGMSLKTDLKVRVCGAHCLFILCFESTVVHAHFKKIMTKL